jgi:hypothetical protein
MLKDTTGYNIDSGEDTDSEFLSTYWQVRRSKNFITARYKRSSILLKKLVKSIIIKA